MRPILLSVLTVTNVTILTSADFRAHLGETALVVGQVERVPAKSSLGTAIVLDDDTVIFVSYGAPPPGFKVGDFIEVEGALSTSMTDDEPTLLAAHLRIPGAPRKRTRALSSLIDHRVRLNGLAKNGKRSAQLQLGRDTITIDGLEQWPAELLNHRVAVGGTFTAQRALQNPTWRLLEGTK